MFISKGRMAQEMIATAYISSPRSFSQSSVSGCGLKSGSESSISGRGLKSGSGLKSGLNDGAGVAGGVVGLWAGAVVGRVVDGGSGV